MASVLSNKQVWVLLRTMFALMKRKPWTVALQAPLSVEFPGNNTGVGCHFCLQGIFLNSVLSFKRL